MEVWIHGVLALVCSLILTSIPQTLGQLDMEKDVLGCFSNSSTLVDDELIRTSQVEHGAPVSFDSTECLDACYKANYSYMGVEVHRFSKHHHMQCRCGNVPPDPESSVADNECASPCSTASTQGDTPLEMWCVQPLADHANDTELDRILVFTTNHKHGVPYMPPENVNKHLPVGAIAMVVVAVVVALLLVAGLFVYKRFAQGRSAEESPILTA